IRSVRIQKTWEGKHMKLFCYGMSLLALMGSCHIWAANTTTIRTQVGSIASGQDFYIAGRGKTLSGGYLSNNFALGKVNKIFTLGMMDIAAATAPPAGAKFSATANSNSRGEA